MLAILNWNLTCDLHSFSEFYRFYLSHNNFGQNSLDTINMFRKVLLFVSLWIKLWRSFSDWTNLDVHTILHFLHNKPRKNSLESPSGYVIFIGIWTASQSHKSFNVFDVPAQSEHFFTDHSRKNDLIFFCYIFKWSEGDWVLVRGKVPQIMSQGWLRYLVKKD